MNGDYRVEFLTSAEREFLQLEKNDRLRVGAKINALQRNPRPVGCKRLAGDPHLWRIRAGNFRVVYAIEDTRRVVSVVRVRHRRDVYRGM